MMEETEEGPIPFEDTPVPEGTPRYLFTYSLLEKEREDGIVGSFKFLGFFKTEEELELLYNKSLPTNKQTQIAWALPGEWEILRQPHTNIEGELTVLDSKENEISSDTDAPKRVLVDDPKAKEALMDRFSVDAFKSRLKIAAAQKKKVELRQKALKELQEQFDDSTTLAYYSRLQYQRLAQKDQIDELRERMDLAIKAHSESVKELRELTGRFPHYKNQWQGEIRRVQALMRGKESKIEFKEGDDELELYKDVGPKEETDEFNEGILLEDKGKDEDDNTYYERNRDITEKEKLHSEITKKALELEEAHKTILMQQQKIAESFLPDSNNKIKKKKDKKKKKAKKPPQVK